MRRRREARSRARRFSRRRPQAAEAAPLRPGPAPKCLRCCTKDGGRTPSQQRTPGAGSRAGGREPRAAARARRRPGAPREGRAAAQRAGRCPRRQGCCRGGISRRQLRRASGGGLWRRPYLGSCQTPRCGRVGLRRRPKTRKIKIPRFSLEHTSKGLRSLRLASWYPSVLFILGDFVRKSDLALWNRPRDMSQNGRQAVQQ